MSEPISTIKIVDNVFVKMMHFTRAGDTHQGHAHTYDHITLLSHGTVKMTHDNGEQEFSAPHLIITPKGVTHKFEALVDNCVLCCIHAIRDGSTVDDVASPELTPQQAVELLNQYPLTSPLGDANPV